MVQLQRLSGMRPGEVIRMRLADIDQSECVWVYRPPCHKNQWRGHERQIFLGPKCQLALGPYLDDAMPEKYLFSPSEAEECRRIRQEAKRITPKTYGNCRGSNRRRNPRRKPGDRYDVPSYRRAIHRACRMAGIDSWSPNQIRHQTATQVRNEFGVESAQVMLGHRNLRMSEHYAETNREQGIEIAKKIG